MIEKLYLEGQDQLGHKSWGVDYPKSSQKAPSLPIIDSKNCLAFEHSIVN